MRRICVRKERVCIYVAGGEGSVREGVASRRVSQAIVVLLLELDSFYDRLLRSALSA